MEAASKPSASVVTDDGGAFHLPNSLFGSPLAGVELQNFPYFAFWHRGSEALLAVK